MSLEEEKMNECMTDIWPLEVGSFRQQSIRNQLEKLSLRHILFSRLPMMALRRCCLVAPSQVVTGKHPGRL